MFLLWTGAQAVFHISPTELLSEVCYVCPLAPISRRVKVSNVGRMIPRALLSLK